MLKGAGVLGDRTRVERLESEESSNVSSSLIVYQCTVYPFLVGFETTGDGSPARYLSCLPNDLHFQVM